jgi:hypothetical protein
MKRVGNRQIISQDALHCFLTVRRNRIVNLAFNTLSQQPSTKLVTLVASHAKNMKDIVFIFVALR